MKISLSKSHLKISSGGMRLQKEKRFFLLSRLLSIQRKNLNIFSLLFGKTLFFGFDFASGDCVMSESEEDSDMNFRIGWKI